MKASSARPAMSRVQRDSAQTTTMSVLAWKIPLISHCVVMACDSFPFGGPSAGPTGAMRRPRGRPDARSGLTASRRENRQVRRRGCAPVSARWSAQALADDDVAAAAAGAAGAGVRRSQVERQRGELGAGGDAELAEHIAQVEVDGAGAAQTPGGGVPVGRPLPA